jgi:hypothetical protein
VVVGSKCPFGCNIVVNVNEQQEIKNLIESYESNCIYGCVLIKNESIMCVKNKCKIV